MLLVIIIGLMLNELRVETLFYLKLLMPMFFGRSAQASLDLLFEAE